MRRSRLAAHLQRRADRDDATKVQLVARRLETRRLLDAAAPALAMELADACSDYVQVSVDYSQLSDQSQPASQSANSPPTNVQIQVTPSIPENGVETLDLTFVDADAIDAHTVEIDWGDGSTVEVLAVPPGVQALSASHQYFDDDPTATPADAYTVQVKVIDAASATAEASTTIAVQNVEPTNFLIDPVLDIDEGGIASLSLSFDDPGTLDAHSIDIDWGDGSPTETISLATGVRTLATTHQYLDDPSGSATSYAITVKVRDDDDGEASGTSAVAVHNVEPSSLVIDPISPIDESGFAALNLSFADPGVLDHHAVEIDWGDGSTVEVLAVPTGLRTFSATHQYLDDDPTATPSDAYLVKVRVVDDDGGAASAAAVVTVNNVEPSILVIDPLATIDENGVATLSLAFDDPGTQDLHTVDVDWGDGSGTETVAVAAGSRTLVATHQYRDDPGGAATSFTITLKVRDDDEGEVFGTAAVTVNNVPPSAIVIQPISPVNEDGVAILNLAFNDPGPLDSHAIEVDWGDGSAAEVYAVPVGARTFAATHQYLDDNPTGTPADSYQVKVRVLDDDGGVATGQTSVTVNNLAPLELTVSPPTSSISEGDGVTLEVAFADPGTQDSHVFDVDWGDGFVSAGVVAGKSFAAAHAYADDGVYAVTVRVKDDDGGVGVATATVTVTNVAPTLAPIADRTSDEGSQLSIADLGMLTDPGFDNPNNPLPGGETAETFTYTIDWGDGTALDAGSAAIDQVGSAGVPTAASFDGAHAYADDGVYVVTVTLLDDDGGQAVQSFSVTIRNVAPTLSLSVDESLIDPIDEGGVVQVNITGLFSDPGFDNPNNTALSPGNSLPETEESFTYEIDWGDGQKTGPISLADVNGSPGVPSAGVIDQFFTHQYLDNDLDGVRDARYAVTVTVFDDDGGASSQTFEVIVYNVNPTLAPIVATDVNNKGETTLTITFDDPGAAGFESFEVLIDWGDQLSTADPLQRFVVEDAYDGQTPITLIFTHTYAGPPDPLNPAADIAITVKIRDDDFGTATSRPDLDPLTIDGQSNVETVAISNPGIGAEPFRIDTTPNAPPLTFPERPLVPLIFTSTQSVALTTSTEDFGGSAGDSGATSERYLELRVINPDGTQSAGYRLRSDVLDNLPALFRNLPDNHYAIYLVQSETNVRRLVIEVYVRNGKLIDPGDDSEGARDRPPTEQDAQPPAVEPIDAERAPIEAESPESESSQAALPRRMPSSTAIYHRTALLGAALAISDAGRNWHRQLERTLATASSQHWKRLKTAGHRRQKKPR